MRGQSSGKKHKVVTFKEDEIIPVNQESSERNPSPNPEKTNEKPKKGKFDGSELDRGIAKLNQKFANKNDISASEGNSPPNLPKKNDKPEKGKVDISELDSGLDKINRKFASQKFASSSDPSSSRLYTHQPWEIDPTFLKIEKVLGHGSFGRVYRGVYKGEQVAIKMLEWGDTNDGEDQHEINLQYDFFREVQIMYKLDNHPNVCKLLGASMGTNNLHVPSPLGRHQVQVSKYMCCIVMEYIDGGNLREFWVKHRTSGKRRMPFGVMVQFAIDIAEGLAFLHSKKVLHRDLKPDNILMDHDCTLKIADFGLSRMWPEQGDDPLSLYKGTPTYAAPEILDGKEYSHKCDVYSYGICIWEIYTCEQPYPSIWQIQSGSINQDIIHKKLRPTIPCCCPPIFRRIMTRCWDANPAKRPEMKEVLQWLSTIDTDKASFLTNDTVVEHCACIVETVCAPRSCR